jgi:hypothetical protein
VGAFIQRGRFWCGGCPLGCWEMAKLYAVHKNRCIILSKKIRSQVYCPNLSAARILWLQRSTLNCAFKRTHTSFSIFHAIQILNVIV